MAEQQVTHVAMESTGFYWQPVYNLLEGHFKLLVINAQHLKKVPGRRPKMRKGRGMGRRWRCGRLG